MGGTLLGGLNTLLWQQNVELNWERCQGNVWCKLNGVNLDDPYFAGLEGVYLIWSTTGQWVRAGQGVIGDRLKVHRADPIILSHQGNGQLLVTWAQVIKPYRDGVERYLGEMLKPVVGSAFPNAIPIQVNIPR